MPGLTTELGRFIANIKYDHLPPETLPLVRDAFADTIGVIMVGIPEPVVDIVFKTIIESGDRREARACLSTRYIAAPDAALIGATAAHALDYDDQSLSGHPSAVLVPAILAEGEVQNSSGRDMVTAYVAGYEVWAELLRRDANYHKKGWHPTSIFGVVAAAASTAVLKRMTADQTATALSIAASHAGGLAANFGTMTKPYHAGMAARSGVISARLAAAGMTAAADALESPAGFLHAFSPGAAPYDVSSPVKTGIEWYLPRQRLCIKKYATCYFMHRSFDATVKMLEGRNLTPADINEIEVTMGTGQTTVLANHSPKTGLEAKFSEEFAMAAAVIVGRLGVDDLTDEVVQRPDIQAFFPKVKLTAIDEYDSRDPAHSPTERVWVRLKNGETLDSGLIKSLKGHADDPMSQEELWAKFAECTAKTHKPADAKKLFDMLQSVEKLASPRSLPSCETIFKS